MHDYLRAVGFSSIKRKKDMDALINQVMESCTEKMILPIASDCKLVQFNKSFGPLFGVTVVGEYDETDVFRVDHCFPYCEGNHITKEDSISLKKIADKEAYSGFCEDYNIGCTMIFFLQNIADYVRNCWSNVYENDFKQVCLGALSIDGSIILGCEKTIESYLDVAEYKRIRREERRLAREGDTEAAEFLALEEMNTYTMISKQLDERQDVYSIVDTTFIPYGVECDQYTVIGIIVSVHKHTNSLSKEDVWLLAVECNDIILNVCINDRDLLGEPMVGRRFKGTIWLQGLIEM